LVAVTPTMTFDYLAIDDDVIKAVAADYMSLTS